MKKTQQMAKDFCKERSLPLTGFVCIFSGKVFQWSRIVPNASAVVPGAICYAIETGEKWVAIGGNDDRGAVAWDEQRARPMR